MGEGVGGRVCVVGGAPVQGKLQEAVGAVAVPKILRQRRAALGTLA